MLPHKYGSLSGHPPGRNEGAPGGPTRDHGDGFIGGKGTPGTSTASGVRTKTSPNDVRAAFSEPRSLTGRGGRVGNGHGRGVADSGGGGGLGEGKGEGRGTPKKVKGAERRSLLPKRVLVATTPDPPPPSPMRLKRLVRKNCDTEDDY